MKSRLNIGVLIDDVNAVFSNQAIKGAEFGAVAMDADLFIIPGMYLDDKDISGGHFQYEYQYSTLFEFARNRHLDILYVMMGMIGCRVPHDVQVNFLKKFLGIPVVCLYINIDNVPSITFDNKISFEKLITHLISFHGVRKLGYVSGPRTNVDAMERLEAYKTALDKAGIPFDEDKVIYGNFEESTEGQVEEFLKSHRDLEGLVFANDRMARGGYNACAGLGIKIGEDLKIVSFDNSKFASALNPPLTTVEANAAELSYKAVMKAEEFINSGNVDDIRVETHPIFRNSCGCKIYNYDSLSRIIDMRGSMVPVEVDRAFNRVDRYLFNEYIRNSEIDGIRTQLRSFVEALVAYTVMEDSDNVEQIIRQDFRKLMEMPVLRYTTMEFILNALKVMQHEMCKEINGSDKIIAVVKMFMDFNRTLALYNGSRSDAANGTEMMARLINCMTADMFKMNSGQAVHYERALDNLDSIGVETAYLYMFRETIFHTRNTEFVPPERLLFKAYYVNKKSYAVPEDKQDIPTEDIFANEYISKEHRKTMILSPIFSADELYGLLLCQVHYEDFDKIEPAALQISVAMKTLHLMEQQEKIQRKLQESMRKIMEDNNTLNDISKKDQLTGLYNRWGFIEKIGELLKRGNNEGRTAVVTYADMDNLKYVNDIYGHDEGDYAIKGIGHILKVAFAGDTVISRYGGDEFVVFMLSDINESEEDIRRRIENIIGEENELSGKEYMLGMSVGICQRKYSSDIDLYDMISMADERLYMDKRRRKNERGTYYNIPCAK